MDSGLQNVEATCLRASVLDPPRPGRLALLAVVREPANERAYVLGKSHVILPEGAGAAGLDIAVQPAEIDADPSGWICSLELRQGWRYTDWIFVAGPERLGWSSHAMGLIAMWLAPSASNKGV